MHLYKELLCLRLCSDPKSMVSLFVTLLKLNSPKRGKRRSEDNINPILTILVQCSIFFSMYLSDEVNIKELFIISSNFTVPFLVDQLPKYQVLYQATQWHLPMIVQHINIPSVNLDTLITLKKMWKVMYTTFHLTSINYTLFIL